MVVETIHGHRTELGAMQRHRHANRGLRQRDSRCVSVNINYTLNYCTTRETMQAITSFFRSPNGNVAAARVGNSASPGLEPAGKRPMTGSDIISSLPGSGSDCRCVKADDGDDSRALSPPVDEESRALHGAVAHFYTEFVFFFFQMVISFNVGLASSAFRAITSVYVSIARITWLNRKLPRMTRVATRVMLALCISTAPLCAKGLSVCNMIASEWLVDLWERRLCRAYD